MPIPSEGLDAHFLPSARRTANAKLVIRFSAKALRGSPKASAASALLALIPLRLSKSRRGKKKKRKGRENGRFIRLALSAGLLCALTRACECSAKKHTENKRTNLRTLLTANSLFNLVYACIVIRKLLPLSTVLPISCVVDYRILTMNLAYRILLRRCIILDAFDIILRVAHFIAFIYIFYFIRYFLFALNQ